ncbi:MAG: hypothetical protein JNL43_00185 [Flavobacteriales bacterium]|nr:hypothetical protein [Flavobacteriales bacterium]
MRAVTTLFLASFASAVAAQPGWEELEFSFVLEHDGVEVSGKELRTGNEYILEINGERVRPFSYNHEPFNTVRFPGRLSDFTMHRDTLWLFIRHRTEGDMAIGFPPRWALPYHELYGTEHKAVDFAPGRVLVTELPTLLLVTGVMEDLGRPWQHSPTYELAAYCGCDTVQNVATGMRNTMDFKVRCRPQRRDGREQTELVLFTRSAPYQPKLEMVVRGMPGGLWPLDTVPFIPTRFVINSGAPRLTPDDAGPRDLVLGEWFRISPVNPKADDAVRFTMHWLGGGERYTVTHELLPVSNDTTELVLTVRHGEREDDPREMFRLNGVQHEVPALPPGSYRLRLVYSDDPARPVPHFPEADGYVIRVGK